jgi:hypothetical protein
MTPTLTDHDLFVWWNKLPPIRRASLLAIAENNLHELQMFISKLTDITVKDLFAEMVQEEKQE